MSSDAGIAAIQMEFGVSGQDIASHQFIGVRHGRFGRQRTPSVGTEVVSAEHDAVDREPDVVRDAFDELAEIGRPHTGVATELVHLVGGGLDQNDLTAGFCLLEGRLDDEGVRRAHRRDAGCAGPHDGIEGMTQAAASFRIVAHMCSFWRKRTRTLRA